MSTETSVRISCLRCGGRPWRSDAAVRDLADRRPRRMAFFDRELRCRRANDALAELWASP